MVILHVKFERGIVNGHSTMNLREADSKHLALPM